MIKLITGPKGSGKTKQMLDMINENLPKVKGNIVCIEKSMQETHNVNPNVRLIDVDEYKVDTYEKFYGLFAGVLAGNYDIEQIYIDGVMKIADCEIEHVSKLLNAIETIANDKFVVITVSAEEKDLPEDLKKYL